MHRYELNFFQAGLRYAHNLFSWALISALICSMITSRLSKSTMIIPLLGSNLMVHNLRSSTTQSNRSINPTTSDTSCHNLGWHYRRGLDWCMDVLTTYKHHLELQIITALSLMLTIFKSTQHALSPFPDCSIFVSRFLATIFNSEDSSALCDQVSSSQPPGQNSCPNGQLTIPRLAAISRQPLILLFTAWLSTDNSLSTDN
jgi:hypothetical protein